MKIEIPLLHFATVWQVFPDGEQEAPHAARPDQPGFVNVTRLPQRWARKLYQANARLQMVEATDPAAMFVDVETLRRDGAAMNAIEAWIRRHPPAGDTPPDRDAEGRIGPGEINRWIDHVLRPRMPGIRGSWHVRANSDRFFQHFGCLFETERQCFEFAQVAEWPVNEALLLDEQRTVRPVMVQVDLESESEAPWYHMDQQEFLCEDDRNPAVPDRFCRPNFDDYIDDIRRDLCIEPGGNDRGEKGPDGWIPDINLASCRFLRCGRETYVTADSPVGTLLLWDEERHRDPSLMRIVGYYYGPTVCVHAEHQDRGLGTALVEHTALLRGGPPTADCDKQMWSRGGLDAHIAAHAKIQARYAGREAGWPPFPPRAREDHDADGAEMNQDEDPTP